MEDPNRTLSVFDEDEIAPDEHWCPHLTFVLCADRLAQPSRRIRLDPGVTSLGWGRAERFELIRDGGEVVVGVPDGRMSSRHARVMRSAGGYHVEDLGSKNGSLVNGVPVASKRRLEDGDLLELGHSFFVFREPGRTWRGDDDGPQGPPGTTLCTLHGPLAEIYRELGRAARSDLPVLIGGETGAGKEVVARAAHAISARAGRFVAVNCGALPETLVESELFGAKKGAFSGADVDRVGLVQAARGGTLFLDEIGELPLVAQAKLLRALQERSVVPLGGTDPVEVDFRLMSATHRDLEKLVADEMFRADLHARITGFSVRVPPLRHRPEDLGLLLRRFVETGGARLQDVTMGRLLARGLLMHSWPYNVRELEKGVGLALALAEHGVLSAKHFSLDPLPAPDPLNLDEEDALRREQLVELLGRHEGNISAVAREMGKARMQIHRWMKRYGIDAKKSAGQRQR